MWMFHNRAGVSFLMYPLVILNISYAWTIKQINARVCEITAFFFILVYDGFFNDSAYGAVLWAIHSFTYVKKRRWHVTQRWADTDLPGLLAQRCSPLLLAVGSEEPSFMFSKQANSGLFYHEMQEVQTLCSRLSQHSQLEMSLAVIADYLLQVSNNCAL